MSAPPPGHPPMPSDSANPLAGGCPVAHSARPAAAASAASSASGCPMAASPPGTRSSEPRDSASLHSAAGGNGGAGGGAAHHPFLYAKASQFDGMLPAAGESVPSNSIPAAGRGNSDDGKAWLNPSANQLFRALARKDKAIEVADAGAVAAVHVAVTDNTWSCIMEYEKLHEKACPNPTLARFNGMDGIYSFKAKMMMRLWGMRPFDRHDWYVNRCGKEVKYIIDYYSFETPDPHSGETSVDYFIDARPAPTVAGLFDRARIAFGKWKRGEKIW